MLAISSDKRSGLSFKNYKYHIRTGKGIFPGKYKVQAHNHIFEGWEGAIKLKRIEKTVKAFTLHVSDRKLNI